MAKDLSKFLSLEGATRKKSPLKSLLPLMQGDMISLGGGTVLQFHPFIPSPNTTFYILVLNVLCMIRDRSEMHGSAV